MSEFFVSLSSIEDVRQFVNAATCCPCEVDVLSGRYVINAKSSWACSPWISPTR